MKAVKTQLASQRSYFDAFDKALRRAGQTPQSSSRGTVLTLEADNVSKLRPLCGSHRIQRIPNGSSKRHTSTATVCITEIGSVGVDLDESDLNETFTRGSGPGGQHRNTSDTCVVLVHKPTGIRVTIDGRSQWQNRVRAREELLKRLQERAAAELESRTNLQRNTQSERSARTFTHNEQRDQVINHETGKKWKLSTFHKGRI